MSLKDILADLAKDREARTHRERHGRGELILLDGVPIRATGCTLPDGSLTDAECLLPHAAVPDQTCRVWTRRLPSTALRRRGRLKVDCGKALFLIDEPEADLVPVSAGPETARPDLERDLGLSPRIRGLVRSELFATLLYGALCNTTWRHKATGTLWHCSWRYAGDVVAGLRCQGDYLDWYCSMGEGLVDEQVLAEIEALGWELAEASPPE
ncbi:MAG TPA: hypothetical protein VJ770_29365 [Stellaceae bacterium]|nr:hypothetical protein [Stellaceae bacterium]